MKNKVFNRFTLISIGISLFAVGSVTSQTVKQYATNRQVQTILNRIESKTVTFKQEVQRDNPQDSGNNNDRQRRINDLIGDFETGTDTFRARFDARQGIGDEVTQLLNKASLIDRFMARNRNSSVRAQTQWTSLKADLNTLARYYRVRWNWNQTVPATNREYTVTETQLRDLIHQVETGTIQYKHEMENALDDSNTSDDSINSKLVRFVDATSRLHQHFDGRQPTTADATDVLNRARSIDQFMSTNRMSRPAERQWATLKTDLSTLATYYRVSWNWDQPGYTPPVGGPYTATDAQLRALLSQIELKTNDYKRQMYNFSDQNTVGNPNAEDSINSYIGKFENATNRLKENFSNGRSTTGDASEVLNRGLYIDRFMARNQMNRPATRQWDSLRTDLNTLASYYRVSWDWNQQIPNYPGTYPNSGIDARITGTYRLNANRSDNVTDVIDRSLGSYTAAEQDNIRRNLERRLKSPDMIAIEKNNRTVSIASSNSPQVTFDADSAARTETNTLGRTITTTATANNSGITINYEGERTNDFYVTFAPSGNNQLSVTRRIYLENRNETVTVSSVYDKINNTAQWSTVNSGNVNNNNGGGSGNVNDFLIPNGTRLTTSLRGTVNTKVSQVGDRFAMEVTSPSQYRGAVIEGRVAQTANSGRISGRANITLEFDTITVNGRSYRFAGMIDGVNASNGDSVTVNNEGTVRDTSQGQTTAVRAGVGAVLGAIIGAIAGGGQGAAIGAGVGAGAGAGSVLITGRDSIELGQGSTFNITATAPANAGTIRSN